MEEEQEQERLADHRPHFPRDLAQLSAPTWGSLWTAWGQELHEKVTEPRVLLGVGGSAGGVGAGWPTCRSSSHTREKSQT